MTRRANRINVGWQTPEGTQVSPFTWEHVAIEVLMDIRQELRELNATLSCYRVRRMSDDINKIDRRLVKHGLKLNAGRKK